MEFQLSAQPQPRGSGCFVRVFIFLTGFLHCDYTVLFRLNFFGVLYESHLSFHPPSLDHDGCVVSSSLLTGANQDVKVK